MAIHGVPTSDVIARAQYGDAAYEALSTTAQDVTLTAGLYYMVWADVEWYFRNAATATTTNGILLNKGEKIYVWASTNKLTISGILASGTGNIGYAAIVAE